MSDLQDKLDHIKTALAELRNTGADGATTRKQLDSLFRQVHSLKAVAAAVGLTDLSRAAHELEDVLHSLRTGESTFDDRVLEQMAETSAALFENLPIPDELFSSLKSEEKHALEQSLKEGANLFLVQTSFDPSDFDSEFQNLKARLNRDGEVISVAPRLEDNKINFRILYATHSELTHLPNVSIEPINFKSVNSWDQIVRAGESAAAALGKDVNFNLRGTEISLDDEIAECLIHLVRNAVHHGIESRGTITITATNDDNQLCINVTDDGRGIDSQTVGHVFEPGFSTAAEVSEISGRGVGLDVVKTTVEARGGSVKVQSEPGKGSTFQISVPKESA